LEFASERGLKDGEVLDNAEVFILNEESNLPTAERAFRKVKTIHLYIGEMLKESGNVLGAEMIYRGSIRLRSGFQEAVRFLRSISA